MSNYECYNIGFKYLQDKYGVFRLSLLSEFLNKIRHLSAKKYREAIENATDDDYQTTFGRLPDDAPIEDKSIVLLLNQYHYGLEVRKELWILLARMKVIKTNIDYDEFIGRSM